MKIGIDIDDTITYSSEGIVEYAKHHKYKDEIINNLYTIVKGETKSKDILEFLNEFSSNEVKNVKIKENAKEIIDKLIKNNEIILITKRGIYSRDFVRTITLDYLKKNKIRYSDIIFSATDKKQVINDYCIDLMIDDSVELIESLGNKGILMTSLPNKNIKTNSLRVQNWQELYKVLNEKNIY